MHKSLLLLVVVLLAIAVWARQKASKQEDFQVGGTTSIEEQVISLYDTVLQRQPSSKELVQATRNLYEGSWTIDGVRQRLIDSEEYQRLVKVQTNGLAPELQKMVSDRALIQRIGTIYLEEFKRNVPTHMVLPLKDVYVLLDYNEYSFRAFLRADKYKYFEDDVKSGGMTVDKEAVTTLIEKHMGSIEKVNEAGKVIAKQAAAAAAAAAPAAAAPSLQGATATEKIVRTVHDKDSDMSPMVDAIVKRCSQVFDKDRVAAMLEKQHDETYNVPIRLHYGQMVLRPDMSWSVPQQSPPVCTTLGNKILTQPVMTNSKLLLGTELDEAASDTSVGSIMPSFEYKEYVPLNLQQSAATGAAVVNA